MSFERRVQAEAMHIARLTLRISIEQRGEKISDYTDTDLTLAARQLIQRDYKITKRARYNLEWATKHAFELSTGAEAPAP